MAGSTKLCVLIDDRLTNGRNTTAEQLFRNWSLFRLERVDQRVAMHLLRGKAGWSITRWTFWTRRSIGPWAAIRAVWAVWSRRTRWSVGPLRSSGSLATVRARTPVGALAVASGTIAVTTRPARTIATATITAITSTAAFFGIGNREGWSDGAFDQLNALDAFLFAASWWDDGNNADSVEFPFGFGAHDIADLRAGIQHGRVKYPLRLFGAGSAPGPPAVGLAGEFDVDAVRHTGFYSTR